MKNLKVSLIVVGSLVSIVANAQFGASNKADYAASADKQGIVANFSPFVRASGGGSDVNGYLVNLEKELNGFVLGGFFGNFEQFVDRKTFDARH